MKQIEVFVDSVYHGVVGKKEEIQELKTEMKSHLLESVHELKSQGKSEKEAIELAIDRFGGEQELRSIVAQLFQAQKTFAKWVLYCSVGVLLISLSFFVFIWQYEEQHSHELSNISSQIFDELRGKNDISPEVKKEIARLAGSTDFLSDVRIYNSKSIRTDGKDSVFYNTELMRPDYQNKRIVWAPEWLDVEFFPYGNGDGQWYVEMKDRSFESLAVYILLGGLAIYWTLFTVWAIINAYHHRRLNIGWIIVFASFNCVGYLVYYVFGKRTQFKIVT